MNLFNNTFSLLQLNAQSWNLVWSDKFNGIELDTTKWQHEVECTSNDQGGVASHYQPQNTVGT